MQETVTSERQSFMSLLVETLETRERQAQAERQLRDDRYRRRAQRLLMLHERQRREAGELRRCLEYVSQDAHVVECALRAEGGAGAGGGSLCTALARQAGALQRCMAQCVANAARIRQLLATAHRHHMDAMLATMEGSVRACAAFVQRAVDAASSSEAFVDNLHNMMAEQRRYVREVSAGGALYRSLCAPADTDGEADADKDTDSPPDCRTRPPSGACSTPIGKDY